MNSDTRPMQMYEIINPTKRKKWGPQPSRVPFFYEKKKTNGALSLGASLLLLSNTFLYPTIDAASDFTRLEESIALDIALKNSSAINIWVKTDGKQHKPLLELTEKSFLTDGLEYKEGGFTTVVSFSSKDEVGTFHLKTSYCGMLLVEGDIIYDHTNQKVVIDSATTSKPLLINQKNGSVEIKSVKSTDQNSPPDVYVTATETAKLNGTNINVTTLHLDAKKVEQVGNVSAKHLWVRSDDFENKGSLTAEIVDGFFATSSFTNTGDIEVQNSRLNVTTKIFENSGYIRSFGDDLGIRAKKGFNKNAIWGTRVSLHFEDHFANFGENLNNTAEGNIKAQGIVAKDTLFLSVGNEFKNTSYLESGGTFKGNFGECYNYGFVHSLNTCTIDCRLYTDRDKEAEALYATKEQDLRPALWTRSKLHFTTQNSATFFHHVYGEEGIELSNPLQKESEWIHSNGLMESLGPIEIRARLYNRRRTTSRRFIQQSGQMFNAGVLQSEECSFLDFAQQTEGVVQGNVITFQGDRTAVSGKIDAAKQIILKRGVLGDGELKAGEILIDPADALRITKITPFLKASSVKATNKQANIILFKVATNALDLKGKQIYFGLPASFKDAPKSSVYAKDVEIDASDVVVVNGNFLNEQKINIKAPKVSVNETGFLQCNQIVGFSDVNELHVDGKFAIISNIYTGVGGAKATFVKGALCASERDCHLFKGQRLFIASTGTVEIGWLHSEADLEISGALIVKTAILSKGNVLCSGTTEQPAQIAAQTAAFYGNGDVPTVVSLEHVEIKASRVGFGVLVERIDGSLKIGPLERLTINKGVKVLADYKLNINAKNIEADTSGNIFESTNIDIGTAQNDVKKQLQNMGVCTINAGVLKVNNGDDFTSYVRAFQDGPITEDEFVTTSGIVLHNDAEDLESDEESELEACEYKLTFPDRSLWKGSDAIWEALEEVQQSCDRVAKLRFENKKPIMQCVAMAIQYGQVVINKLMQDDTPGSGLIEDVDAIVGVLKELPHEIDLYSTKLEKHCLGHSKVGGHVDESGHADINTPSAHHLRAVLLGDSKIDKASIEITEKRAEDVFEHKEALRPDQRLEPIPVVRYKHQKNEGCCSCTNYEERQVLLLTFKPSTIINKFENLKQEMRLHHKGVMKKRADELEWKEVRVTYCVNWRTDEWHGTPETRGLMTFLARLSENIKNHFYENERLLDLATGINKLCKFISENKFTGYNNYIEFLIKELEKLPDVIGEEETKEVTECQGHNPDYKAYSLFSVKFKEEEVWDKLFSDKNINPTTIETRQVNPYPVGISTIFLCLKDTSFVEASYKHVDDAPYCYNGRKVTKKVGGIKKEEIIKALKSLKNSLPASSDQCDEDERLAAWERAYQERASEWVHKQTVSFEVSSTWGNTPTFTPEQLERFRNRGQTNAEVAEVGRRMQQGLEQAPQAVPRLNGVPQYSFIPAEGMSLVSPSPLPGDNRGLSRTHTLETIPMEQLMGLPSYTQRDLTDRLSSRGVEGLVSTLGELNPEVALQTNALRTGIPADVLRVVQSQGNLTFLPPVSVAETYRVGPYNANADSFQFLQGVRSLPEPLPVVESVAAQSESPERLTSEEIMRVGTQTINDLLAKADYEQATPDERFHLACDLWDIDGDLPNLDLGARSSEKPGIIKSIDDSISRTKKVSDTFMTNLQKRDPEAYAMMEKALGWGATVAQVSAMCNPYTAVGTGAVMVADASGVTGWAKEKISAGLKEIGFEKSSDTLAAGLMFVVEGKAQKKATQAAAGSKVLNGIVEKSGQKFKNTKSEKTFVQPTYHKAPKILEAFPDAKSAPRKTSVQGGGHLRERWKDKNHIYEWDSKKGKVEMYDKTGRKHLGEFDPVTGETTGPAKPNRKVEK